MFLTFTDSQNFANTNAPIYNQCDIGNVLMNIFFVKSFYSGNVGAIKIV